MCWGLHLLPSADSGLGRSRCPEARQPPDDAPAGLLCLKSQEHLLYLEMVSFITSLNPKRTLSTYSIQEPADGAVSSTHQDPVLIQTAEEVKSEETEKT